MRPIPRPQVVGMILNTSRIGEDRYKVVIEPGNARALAAEHALVVQSGFAFAAGDAVEVFGIEVDIFKVKYLIRHEFGRFNWKLWISGDFVPELKGKLIFKVAGGHHIANPGLDQR